MVVVINEAHPETEPMLPSVSSEDPMDTCSTRRNSFADIAYRNISSSIKENPLEITSTETALELLTTGIRLKNVPLITQCTENLDYQLDQNSVLKIYSRLSTCQATEPLSTHTFEPSAPPITEDDHLEWVRERVENLRFNCLLEIDKYADSILRQKLLLDLSYPDILAIVERDTLEVSSELSVYSAIIRWATEECRRRTLRPHDLNVRAVLRRLAYAPRYGLMSKKEFKLRVVDGEKGPTRSGILDEKDWRKILFYIGETSKGRPVEELPHKWSAPRVKGFETPKLLSARSLARGKEVAMREVPYREKTRCDKFIINLLTCWTAVFD